MTADKGYEWHEEADGDLTIRVWVLGCRVDAGRVTRMLDGSYEWAAVWGEETLVSGDAATMDAAMSALVRHLGLASTDFRSAVKGAEADIRRGKR